MVWMQSGAPSSLLRDAIHWQTIHIMYVPTARWLTPGPGHSIVVQYMGSQEPQYSVPTPRSVTVYLGHTIGCR